MALQKNDFKMDETLYKKTLEDQCGLWLGLAVGLAFTYAVGIIVYLWIHRAGLR